MKVSVHLPTRKGRFLMAKLIKESVMTVEKTRQLLGSEVASLTDSQIKEMIDSAINFCEVIVDNLPRNKKFQKLLNRNVKNDRNN